MNESITPYDLDQTPQRTPEEELWLKVLELFLKDAVAMLIKVEPNKHQMEAFDDLIRGGAITRRIAGYNDINPEWMSTKFKLYVQQFY
jgi:hypothetical protein